MKAAITEITLEPSRSSERSAYSWLGEMGTPWIRLSHKLLGNFSATFEIFGNFLEFW